MRAWRLSSAEISFWKCGRSESRAGGATELKVRSREEDNFDAAQRLSQKWVALA
jgi:hypothetical protein